jgi:hypothetical protein
MRGALAVGLGAVAALLLTGSVSRPPAATLPTDAVFHLDPEQWVAFEPWSDTVPEVHAHSSARELRLQTSMAVEGVEVAGRPEAGGQACPASGRGIGWTEVRFLCLGE